MSAYLLALMSYAGWGAGDIFGAIAARRIGGVATTFWIMTLAAILFFPYAVIERTVLSNSPLPILITAIVLGLLYQLGNIAVSEALRKTNASVVLTVMGSFGALVVLFSTVFLREPITLLQIGIIAAIFSGVILTTWTEKAQMSPDTIKGALLAGFAAVCFGIFFTANKVIGSVLGWFWPLYLSFLWLPVIYAVSVRQGFSITYAGFKNAAWPLIATMILLRGGDFIFNIGLGLGYSAIVAPIGTASPTLSVLLAFIVFRERLTARQSAGILLALVGIVALGLTGR